MKFNFFTPPAETTILATEHTALDRQRMEHERAKLNDILYKLLERMPQAMHLEDNIAQLCRTILDAAKDIRFIWIGLREQVTGPVPPLVIEGEYAADCSDWRLPQPCFDFKVPFSQAALESVGTAVAPHSLFAPWLHNLDSCTVSAALAIPLRSDRSGVRGLMVFYATDIDYFAQVGVAPFQAFCHLAELLWKQDTMLQLLSRKTQVDGLTGLMTRRKIVIVLTRAMAHAELINQPLSILLCHVEGFDKLNDVYGWFDADAILAAFVKEVATLLPPDTCAGRWTGVDMLYVLPGCDGATALAQADSVFRHLQEHTISVKNWSVRMTVSIGVASLSPHCNGLDDLLHQAKQQMRTDPY